MAVFTNRAGDVLTIPLFEDVIQDFSVSQKRPPVGLFILSANVPEQSRAALCQALKALDDQKEYVTFAQAGDGEASLKLMVATSPEYDSDRRRLTVTLRDCDRSKYFSEVKGT